MVACHLATLTTINAFWNYIQFHLLENDNSLREYSKSVKIVKCAEQTLGKNLPSFSVPLD